MYTPCLLFLRLSACLTTQRKLKALTILMACLCTLLLTAPAAHAATAAAVSLHPARLATACANMIIVRDDGRIWQWGVNNWSTDSEEPRPVRFKGAGADFTFPEKVVAVAAGHEFSYFLCADGSLWAYGRNIGAQVGIAKPVDLTSPVKIMDDVAQVSVLHDKTTVVKRDGTLWAWGYTIPLRKLADHVQRVAFSPTHGLALMRNGSLMAWGDNRKGQLGTGSHESTFALVPVTIELGPSPVVAIAAKQDVSVAVTADGKLRQWGYKNTSILSIPQLPTEQVRSVTFGGWESLVLKTDGTLWTCYPNKAPVQVLANVAEFSTSHAGTHLALKNDGSFWVWGKAEYSALGVNSREDSATPSRLYFIDEPEPLSPALRELITAKAALPPIAPPQRAVAMGRQGSGYIVRVIRKGVFWETNNIEPGPHYFTKVSSKKALYENRLLSDWHSLFFDGNTLMSKGENDQGQLGDGTIIDRESPVPVRMPEGITINPARVSVLATAYEQSGMVMDGVIWLWGKRGMTEDNKSPRGISTPRPLAFAAGEVVDMALLHTISVLFLTKDGNLWITNSGRIQQEDEALGYAVDEHTTRDKTPHKILTGVHSFASDGDTHVALKKDGSLWGWSSDDNCLFSYDRFQDFPTPEKLDWKFKQ